VVGLRVTSGDGSHLLRLETALEQFDDDTEDLLERLDASRSRRNEASYASMLIAQASVDEAREATAELIELARDFVG
jgi:cell division septum initiation protein DivIVA